MARLQTSPLLNSVNVLSFSCARKLQLSDQIDRTFIFLKRHSDLKFHYKIGPIYADILIRHNKRPMH